MEVKKAPKIPYTEKQWNLYKERLANELSERALTAEDAVADSDVKTFISNYTAQELFDQKKETQRLLSNTNIRLAHTELETNNGKRIYPVINEYKGHHVMKTYYFYRGSNGVSIGCVEVNPSTILIP